MINHSFIGQIHNCLLFLDAKCAKFNPIFVFSPAEHLDHLMGWAVVWLLDCQEGEASGKITKLQLGWIINESVIRRYLKQNSPN